VLSDNYQNFKAADFLDDDYFISWRTDNNKEVSNWWNEWLLKNPHKKEAVDKAIEQYNLITGFKRITPTADQHNNTWLNIEHNIFNAAHTQPRTKFLYWFAAAAVIAITTGIWFFNRKPDAESVLIASGDKNKTIVLPDSSVIILNKNSSLRYTENNEREVWIEGSGYFQVNNISTPGKRVPFAVHAGNLDINVLGTIFSVVNTPLQCIAVLKEGKIEANAFSKTVLLSPGKKITVSNSDFTISNVNAALYNPWIEGNFHFDNTSIDELTDIVSVFFQRNLTIKNREKLKIKSISGIVAANDTATFVKTLSILLNARIDLNEKELIINPK